MTVRARVAVLREAVRVHYIVVEAGPVHLAARSTAEAHGLRYVFVASSPTTLPSPAHPPARTTELNPFTLSEAENRARWADKRRRRDELFRGPLNEERARLGLPPLDGVMTHMLSASPWLATDPTLAPAGSSEGCAVVQIGARSLRPSP